MRKQPTILMTMALIVLLATTALAQPGQRGSRGLHRSERGQGAGPEMRVERLAARLDLSEEQQTAVARIHDDARVAAADIHKELARLQNQRRGEMLKDDPSEQTLIDLTEEMGAQRTRLQVNRLQARLAVRALLTDDQRDQFMLMGSRQGGGSGRGHGAGHGECRGTCDGDGPGRRGHDRRSGRGMNR